MRRGAVVGEARVRGVEPSPRSASRQRAVQDLGDRRLVERLQDEHLRAREQRRVDLERRVLGGGADEDEVAGLDAGQEGVLLRLVEAVDLVDEEDRAAARAAAAPPRPRPSPP